MFRILRPGRLCGPAKGKTNTRSGETTVRDQGPPPRLELPRRKTAGALKSPHLKPVDQTAMPRTKGLPIDPRASTKQTDLRASARAVSRPIAQPMEQPARPVIPPYPVFGAQGAATPTPGALGAATPTQGSQASRSRTHTAEVQSFGRLMLVGPQIRLKGEIKACERLVVEGVVEGEVSDTDRLEIARGGRFQGTAQIESCAIDGIFEGELDVCGVLTLKANGRIAGKVRYGEIEIERGGIITGDFSARGATEVSGQTGRPLAGRPLAGRSANSTGPRSA